MRQERPLVYWDFLGAHKAHSGLHTHMMSLKKALGSREVFPEFVGEKSSFYQLLLSLPLSKLTCPHYSSFLLSKVKAKSQKAVFHSFANLNVDFLLPRSPFLKKVLTVHDVIPLLAREKSSYLSYFQFKSFLGASLGSSDQVLCVSSWTKACLEELFPEHRNKLKLVPNGVSRELVKATDSEKKEGPLHALCVSRFEWYKRFDLPLQFLDLDPSLRLSFVTNEKGEAFLEKALKEKGFSHRVQIFKNLKEQELSKLYAKCDVFLHPSLYEGFCLPAYEALRFLKPVVFQRGHALDELPDTVSVGLDSSAKAIEWLEALYKAKRLSEEDSFETFIRRALDSCLTWEEVAERVKKLYLEF